MSQFDVTLTSVDHSTLPHDNTYVLRFLCPKAVNCSALFATITSGTHWSFCMINIAVSAPFVPHKVLVPPSGVKAHYCLHSLGFFVEAKHFFHAKPYFDIYWFSLRRDWLGALVVASSWDWKKQIVLCFQTMYMKEQKKAVICLI